MVKYQQEEVEKFISELSNEELVNYIHAAEGTYLPEAIDFARQVLESRHLSPQEISELEEQATSQKIKEQKEESAHKSTPLAWYWKPWIVVCGLSIFLFVPVYVLLGNAIRFSNSGEKRKARQLWIYAFTGLLLLALSIYPFSQKREELLFSIFVPRGILRWIFVPLIPSIFIGARLRRYMNIQRDSLPKLSETEFKRMKRMNGSAFGILGISVLLVFITSVFLFEFTTQNLILKPRNIAVVGLGIAYLLDLKADAIKKRGCHN